MSDNWESPGKVESARIRDAQSANTTRRGQLSGRKDSHQAWSGNPGTILVPAIVAVLLVGFFLSQNWNGMPFKDFAFVFGIFGLVAIGIGVFFWRHR